MENTSGADDGACNDLSTRPDAQIMTPGADERIRIRPAITSDLSALRDAVIALHDHERRLHASRLLGEQIADAYLAWLKDRAAEDGAILVAESDGAFAGFAAGWIENEDSIPEAPDWRRFGYISDICVMSSYRGRGIAGELLQTLESALREAGARLVRIGVLAMNKVARSTYEKNGYSAYEVIYEKALTSDGSIPASGLTGREGS
jgi:ribosomal protein S18 acetylase RimI-like enzyme